MTLLEHKTVKIGF